MFSFLDWWTEDTSNVSLQNNLRTSKWGLGYVAQSNKLVDKWQIKFLKLWGHIVIGNRIDVVAIKDL